MRKEETLMNNPKQPHLKKVHELIGKVLTKGGGVGGGERNLQLSLRFYF